TRAATTSTSRRRCSTRRSGPWSWRMTDTWSERAEAYRHSDAHSQGRDLELFAEWAEGEKALDVATGGGNVARVLQEAGLDVVTIDSAPGMRPTVISRAEEI